MKQPPFKKLFIIVGSLIVLSGFVWVIAQSDTASLVINTDRFNAVQEIQEVHINEQQGAALSSTKAGMKVEKSGVLGIGTVDTRTNRVGALKNTVNSDTSVIAGSGNRNEAGVGSFILGGEKNRASGTKVNSLIIGSTATDVSASGTIILASSGVKVSAPSVVAVGLENARVNAGNAILFVGNGITINKPGALTVGSNITVNHDGVFAFNAKGPVSTAKEHVFFVNADQGMMIGTDNNLLGSSVQLTVDGAVKVGKETTCTTAQNGTV
ncbi:MAG: hypothetical protein DLD55_05040, partial [candidate division SR1 bacterium]